MNIKTPTYIALFATIQVVSLVLTIVGLPITAILAYGNFAKVGADRKWHWPKAFWLWDNNEDGVSPDWYHQAHANRSVAANEFMWTGLRNSVNNLRYVSYVSGKDRPLWYRAWTIRNKQFYAKAGWVSAGWPVLSIGAGRGY